MGSSRISTWGSIAITPRNGGPALLPAGQLEGDLSRSSSFSPTKAAARRTRASISSLGQAHIFRAEGNILIGGVLKELMFRILEDHPHPEPDVPDLFGSAQYPGPPAAPCRRWVSAARSDAAPGWIFPSRCADDADEVPPLLNAQGTPSAILFSNGVPGE